MAFRDEFPDAVVTVVVDATFGHRIDRREATAFDEAVAHNELVAPPAGAIGRGDAFVLSIANKVGARSPQQRLVPGVPRRLPVALRRWALDRRQARAVRRLGLRGTAAGQGRGEPQGTAGCTRRRGSQGGAPVGEQGSEPADAGADVATAECEATRGKRDAERPCRFGADARTTAALRRTRSTTSCRSSISSSTTRSAAASTGSSSRTRRMARTSRSATSVATCRSG